MRLPAWLVLGVLVVAPSMALAQPTPKVRAGQLFEDGRALAKQGKHVEACAKFTESFALDPAPGTRLNVGDCLEREGKLIRAKKEFESAAAEFDNTRDDDRAKFARSRVDALVPRIATVTLKLHDLASGTRVRMAGQDYPAAPEIQVQVDPGLIEIVVTAPGKPPFTRSETVTAGAKVTFDGPKPIVVPPITESVTTRRKRSRVKLAIGIGIGGAVAGIAGVGIGGYAFSRYDKVVDGPECSQDPLVCTDTGLAQVKDAQSIARVGTVVGLAGGAMLVAASILYLTAPDETVQTRATVQLAPTASATSLGLALDIEF